MRVFPREVVDFVGVRFEVVQLECGPVQIRVDLSLAVVFVSALQNALPRCRSV